MNLRGMVVPIIGLRERFGMSPTDFGQFSVVIIFHFGRKLIGAIVDTVSDVLRWSPSEIHPAPDLGASVDTSFIIGLARAGDRLVTVLDMNRIFADITSITREASGTELVGAGSIR